MMASVSTAVGALRAELARAPVDASWRNIRALGNQLGAVDPAFRHWQASSAEALVKPSTARATQACWMQLLASDQEKLAVLCLS